MGFVNTRDASYAKEYRRIVGAMLLQMQDLENLAMRPVVDVINDMFAEPAKPMPIIRFYSGPAADAEEDRAPALLPRHSTVLSLRKKDLASI
jgi:hypothetical protein